MPPGTTPPLILNYNASTVPILQLALSGEGLSEQELSDLGHQHGAHAAGHRAGRRDPVSLRRQDAPDPDRPRPRGAAGARPVGQDVANALAAQNLITPGRHAEDRQPRIHDPAQQRADAIDELGDLPIKVVNGAMVYMRDVATRARRQPAADQHRARRRQPLGAAVGAEERRGLDAGHHRRHQGAASRRSRRRCPTTLEITLARRPVAVRRAARSAAWRTKAIIAAALTSLMILLFLGSWRSTVIIAISIPLAVLGSIALLAALGETLNIMTLGGLALAVGILVDDATVTIENINWHLEQGKDVETAILDGAQQIVTPAFVSLLCICIVFVPMFFLEGVARFLFVPMAEAVMFAMVCSFILSRTLVPTMAKYLLQPHDAHGHASKPPSRNPLVPLPARLRARASSASATATAACWRWRSRTGRCLRHRASWPSSLASFLLVPFLGRNFFPSRRYRPDPDARARAGRHARRGDRPPVRRHREGDPRDHPADELATMVDNIGMPVSGINMTYNNTGTIGPQDGDIQIALKRGPPADRGLRARAARRAAAAVPRRDVLVPAGRHRQPDPELRRAGADRPADPRPQPRRRTSTTPTSCWRGSARSPASPTRASSSRATRRASTSTSTARARSMSALTERDVTNSLVVEPRRQRARSRRPTGSIRRTASPIRS